MQLTARKNTLRSRALPKQVIEFFNKFDIVIKKVPQSKPLFTGIPIKLEDDVYALFKKGKEIFRGTKKDVEALSEKLKKMSDKEAKKYVDDLANDFKNKTKSRKPTKADLDELNDIRIALNAGKNKNVAFTKGEIGGKKIDLKSRSGEPKGTPENFDNFKQIKPENYHYKNGPLNRQYDSEQKQIEYLYDMFKNNKQVKGKIEIVSDLQICPNCVNIIDRFVIDFPNIEVIKVWVRESL